MDNAAVPSPGCLGEALGYLERWIGFQMRVTKQPGCSLAVVHDGELVLERSFGVASLATGEALGPRHRFRIASQSKAFTAAAIMLLRERDLLRLDDRVDHHVDGLHPALADATIVQLLSHSAGLASNGTEMAYWNDLGPWPTEAALRGELSRPLILAPGERHKYSNLGFGLLGLVIQSASGEPYGAWVEREVVRAAGLHETTTDWRTGDAFPLATGHAAELPMGRFTIAGLNVTDALAAATGFISTPGDLARFFAQLDPAAGRSILSPASRREMVRRHWKAEPFADDVFYGLGIASGSADGHDFFGHSGSFQGFQSRTCVIPEWRLTLSAAMNAIDAPAGSWIDTAIHVLDRFLAAGETSEAAAAWTGRWWNLWGACELVPMGERVAITAPEDSRPFEDTDEMEPLSGTLGRIVRSPMSTNLAEMVERSFGPYGRAEQLRVAGDAFTPEEAFIAMQTALNSG